MPLKDDLTSEVKAIFAGTWTERDGTVVPDDTSVKLNMNDAVKINGTVLYADLADSTKLVDGHKPWFAAEIYKTFLLCASKVIRSEGGVITAYDGDRIMAVFIGDSKNTSAARSALKINWCCKQLIHTEMDSKYNNKFKIRHVCGIDTSPLFVAKTGIRGSNDLVWVGRAANYAAKLSALDHAFATRITKSVYSVLAAASKYANGVDMWQPAVWKDMDNLEIYRSTYWWSL
jgi:class 3 adenylate cyclase